MAQVPPRYCPRCGAPIVTNSRFCTTCGLPVEAMLSSNTQRQPTQDYQYDQEQLPRVEQHASQYNPHVQKSYQQTSVEALETAVKGEQRGPQNVPLPFT